MASLALKAVRNALTDSFMWRRISKRPDYFFTFPYFSRTYFFVHSLFYLFVLTTFSDLICQLIAYFDRITDCIVERSTWLTKMRIAE